MLGFSIASDSAVPHCGLIKSQGPWCYDTGFKPANPRYLTATAAMSNPPVHCLYHSSRHIVTSRTPYQITPWPMTTSWPMTSWARMLSFSTGAPCHLGLEVEARGSRECAC